LALGILDVWCVKRRFFQLGGGDRGAVEKEAQIDRLGGAASNGSLARDGSGGLAEVAAQSARREAHNPA